MGILTEGYINDVLKVDEEWDMELQTKGWADCGDELSIAFDKVVKLLTPKGIVPEYKRIKITHSDNVTDLSMFLDLYEAMLEIEPIEVIGGIAIRELNGKRYATEYAEGGLVAIYYFE